MYKLVKSEECKVIQKKINTKFSHLTDNGKGFGYSWGYWYFIYLHVQCSDYSENYEVYLLAIESSYLELTNNIIEEEIETNTEVCVEQPKIDIIDRHGAYNNLWYKIRNISTPILNDRSEQIEILNKIVAYHDIHKQTTVFLHGKPGVGKSMIGIMLANKYNGIYCDTFVPWEPNDTLVSIITEAMPCKKRPLILVLEEIDIAIQKIHINQIQPHKNFSILIHDKTSWNRFFDRIQRGIYPNIIVILTSNKSPDYINSLDSSYLRDNRVNLLLELV
jgi:Cdc6-like AAA superfamily ATPase